MNRKITATGLALVASLGLSACVGGGYGGGFGGGYGGGYAYDGFYDNHYGPIYDGYWGEGDTFYYRSARRGHYVRDNDRHFRRDMNGVSGGYAPMHITGPRPGHHRGPR